jgi:hypothetical protein
VNNYIEKGESMNKFKPILFLVVIIFVSQFLCGCTNKGQSEEQSNQVEEQKSKPEEQKSQGIDQKSQTEHQELRSNPELEKEYQLLLDQYNKRIAQQKDTLDLKNQYLLSFSKTTESALNKSFEQYEKFQGEYFKERNEFWDSEERIMDIVEKRQLLKIKILEKYGVLPKWWNEEEFIYPKEEKFAPETNQSSDKNKSKYK